MYHFRPWRSWITQQIPILESGGSNPFGRAKTESTHSGCSRFYSIIKRWDSNPISLSRVGSPWRRHERHKMRRFAKQTYSCEARIPSGGPKRKSCRQQVDGIFVLYYSFFIIQYSSFIRQDFQ